MSDLPVVKMCGNQHCGGVQACDRVRAGKRTMALVEWLPPEWDDALAVRFFQQELAISAPTDSHGVQHMVPPGCEFTIHKGHRSIPDADLLPEHRGKEQFAAIYSGPDADLDDILAASPEYGGDLVERRLAELRAA